MKTFSVKNFDKFQHYKDRAPPWIKLYNELLDDYEFGRLQDASKMHLIAIWLLASRSENKIPYDPEWIARRINATDMVDLDALARAGFIVVDQELHNAEQVASKPLAECLPRERVEGEERQNAAAGAAHLDSPPVAQTDEAELYRRSKIVLGQSSGGMVSKLVVAKGGSVPLARAAIEMAATKGDPREYIGRIIRGKGDAPEDLRARGEAW